MNISYNELKNKEIINLNDGSKLGHIIDVVFDSVSGKILGITVPGERKFFHKNNELFIGVEKIRRIGDDVILVRVDAFNDYSYKNSFEKNSSVANAYSNKIVSQNGSYIRFRRIDNKKYK